MTERKLQLQKILNSILYKNKIHMYGYNKILQDLRVPSNVI